LDLGCDHHACCLVVGNEIDHAACRPMDGDLDESRPTWIEEPNERLCDPGLDRVAEPRSGAWIEADADAAPERIGDRHEHREAWLAQAALDERKVPMVDARHVRQPPQRQARIETQATDLGPDRYAHVATDS